MWCCDLLRDDGVVANDDDGGVVGDGEAWITFCYFRKKLYISNSNALTLYAKSKETESWVTMSFKSKDVFVGFKTSSGLLLSSCYWNWDPFLYI